MKDAFKNATREYFMPLIWLKDKCRYVNQWNVMLYALVFIQIWASYTEHDLGLHTLWSIGLVWGLFIVGYNSMDRELEINLERAKEAIKNKGKK